MANEKIKRVAFYICIVSFIALNVLYYLGTKESYLKGYKDGYYTSVDTIVSIMEKTAHNLNVYSTTIFYLDTNTYVFHHDTINQVWTLKRKDD